MTDRKTALITGASSGIGLELAKLFAADKIDVILVARIADKLASLASEIEANYQVRTHVLPVDLAEDNAARQLVNRLTQSKLRVDFLVNNAGFGAVGNVADLTFERQASMIQVNVKALTELTRLVIPDMIQCNAGGILNLASTAAFQPGPGMAVYYATKAYVLSFSEALHEELRGTGVRVSCLAPGPTATGFGDDSGMTGSFLFRMGAMNAKTVAQAGYRGLFRNQAIVIPGVKNKLGAVSVRFFPRFAVRRIVQFVNRTSKHGP
jgi:uncharacterized protein